MRDDKSCASGREAQIEADNATIYGVENEAEFDDWPDIIILDEPPSATSNSSAGELVLSGA